MYRSTANKIKKTKAYNRMFIVNLDTPYTPLWIREHPQQKAYTDGYTKGYEEGDSEGYSRGTKDLNLVKQKFENLKLSYKTYRIITDPIVNEYKAELRKKNKEPYKEMTKSIERQQEKRKEAKLKTNLSNIQAHI